MAEDQNLYLYLAKRNRTEIKVLSVFRGNGFPASRVNLEDLNLPQSIYPEIEKIVAAHTSHWELWLEGAPNQEFLKTSLRKRGYSLVDTNSNVHDIEISVKKLPVRKTMVRRVHEG